MTYERKSTGNYGEDLATQFLKKRGLKIIERNFSSKLGEIDILARPPSPRLRWINQKSDIVIVEVKTKSGGNFGEGFEMVNYHKKRKLLLLAKVIQQKYPDRTIRIDIISIDANQNPPELKHFVNAVEES